MTGWEAEYHGYYGPEATFRSGLDFNVSFVGGNDLIVTWQALAGTATILRLCTADGSCVPPRYPGTAPANLTVELVDAANASLPGAIKSFSVDTFLGEQIYQLALSSSSGGGRGPKYTMTLDGIYIPHTCRWTAQLSRNRTVVVESLMPLKWPQLNTWQCVVPIASTISCPRAPTSR